MRPYFRPMLVPTLWLAPLLAVLISLGVWQGFVRLPWKLDLLAKIHAGLTAPPVDLQTVLASVLGDENSRQDVRTLTSAEMSEVDYRRVIVRGRFDNRDTVLFFTTGSEGEPTYHVMTPFWVIDLWQFGLCKTCNRDITVVDGSIWVDRGWIPASMPRRFFDNGIKPGQDVTIVGIIRKPAPPGFFTPPVDLAHRIVHTRDPQALAAAFHLRNVFPMFLEADATPNPGGWPKGGVTIVDLPNDHLQYAITWFGLALGLFVVYLAYHQSQGRLGWKRANER